MPDLRFLSTALVVVIVSAGTRYSIRHATFLDTSDPYSTHTHHLANTHYFASKRNLLNTTFLKLAWGWTTFAFLPLILTAPARYRRRRFLQYLLATLSWLVFTTWFFGPAVFERIISSTGGVCVVHASNDLVVSVPMEYCFNHERISHASHPHLFPSPLLAFSMEPSIPRLRRGHDVSGHIFLLTLSVLFLGDQVRQSLYLRKLWNRPHIYALGGTGVLLSVWLFSLWITSVYFHTAAEKFSGLILGIATFGITQVPLNFLAEGDESSTIHTPGASKKQLQGSRID